MDGEKIRGQQLYGLGIPHHKKKQHKRDHLTMKSESMLIYKEISVKEVDDRGTTSDQTEVVIGPYTHLHAQKVYQATLGVPPCCQGNPTSH